MDRGQPAVDPAAELRSAAASASRVIEVEATPIPPGEEPGAPPPGESEVSFDDLAAIAVNLALSFAQASNPIWAPGPGEEARIAKSLAPVLAKWMPGTLANWGPEFGLVLVLGSYALPRFAKRAAQEEQAQRAAEDTQAGAHVAGNPA